MGNFQFEVPEIISEKLSRGDGGENSSHRDESERVEKEAVFYNTQGAPLCLEQVLWGRRKPVRPKEGVRKVPLTIYKTQIPHKSRSTAD